MNIYRPNPAFIYGACGVSPWIAELFLLLYMAVRVKVPMELPLVQFIDFFLNEEATRKHLLHIYAHQFKANLTLYALIF